MGDFTVADTDTVTTSARGPLMPNLRQMPKLESHSTVMLTVSILMVSVPTVSLKSTNDLLMLNPKQRLMPKLLPHTTVDTTAVDTDTVTDTDTDTVLDTVDTMVDTTAVDTDTVVDTSTVNLNIKWL